MARPTSTEINTSSTWYLLLFAYLMNMGYAIVDALALLPSYVYENNPAQAVFIPCLDGLHAIKLIGPVTIATVLVPVFLGAVLRNTWRALKNYYQAKKTFGNTIDIIFNVLTSVAVSVFAGLMIFGNANMMLCVAPYLLVAVTGSHVLYHLLNMMKQVYSAYKAPKGKGVQHGLLVMKHLLALAINAFGLIVTVFFGIQVGEIVSHLGGNLFQIFSTMQTIGVIFSVAKPFFYALSSLVAVSASLSACSIAQQKIFHREEMKESYHRVIPGGDSTLTTQTQLRRSSSAPNPQPSSKRPSSQADATSLTTRQKQPTKSVMLGGRHVDWHVVDANEGWDKDPGANVILDSSQSQSEWRVFSSSPQ